MPRAHHLLPAAALVALLLPQARGDEPAPDVTEPPAYEEFVVIPLRVHVLTADDLPEVDCRLSDSDVTRILDKVNRIWHKAGVHFGLESLVREPAARQGRFRAARDLADEPTPLGLYRVLLPEASRRFDGLHVYYIHRFPVNGVYLGDGAALVQETARLKPVEGGIDEPLPRVTAHELGHALGLSHRQDRTNLLASGTTGTSLNRDEAGRARDRARSIRGARPVADLRREAEAVSERGDTATARRFWTWLSEIPGDQAREARRRLDELPPKDH
jgi:hypothetical protein